jgi:hypothetical protein
VNRFLKGVAAGAGLVGAVGGAILLSTRPAPHREVVDINVDRGLSDCPWPPNVRDPNGPWMFGPDVPDHEGDVARTNAYLVLRDNDRVFLAEPVREVRCIRFDPGPDIVIELDPYLGPLGDDVPPPVDPNVMSPCHDAAADVIAYRRVRKLLHDARVTEPFAFDDLEDWYKRNHHGEWLEGALLPMGKTAVATYHVTMYQCGEPLIKIDVKFFRDKAARHVCVPGGQGGGALPPCPDAGSNL